MTAMCDVAFLLLSFFILATKFKPPEALSVVTPNSVSSKVAPDKNVVLVTLDKDGTIYVVDAGGAALRVLKLGATPQVSTLVGYHGSGIVDGLLADARLRSPSGVAVAGNGTLIVADTGNRLLRVLVGEKRERGKRLTQEAALALYPTAEQMRRSSETEPRWPYEPATRPREIAATFGEASL